MFVVKSSLRNWQSLIHSKKLPTCYGMQLVRVVSQMNSGHTLFPCFFNFHFNIIFPYTPRPFKLLNDNELSFTCRVKWLFSVTLILGGCNKDELKPALSHYPVAALRCAEEAMQIGDDSFGMLVASEDPFVLLKAPKSAWVCVFATRLRATFAKRKHTQFRLLVGQSWGRNYAAYSFISVEGAHRCTSGLMQQIVRQLSANCPTYKRSMYQSD